MKASFPNKKEQRNDRETCSLTLFLHKLTRTDYTLDMRHPSPSRTTQPFIVVLCP